MTRPQLRRVSWRKARRLILARDGWTCQYCGAPATVVDHVIPADLWRGHHDDPENLKAACASCNNFSLPNKQKRLAERSGRPERHERDGAPVPIATFAYHRHVGPDGAGLFGHMGIPWPEDAGRPPDCPLPKAKAA